MKILLVSPLPPPPGGIETVTANLVSHFNSNNEGISLILCNTVHKHRPPTSQSLFLRIITGVINSTWTYFKVKELIKKEYPNVLHISSSASLSLIKDLLIIRLGNRNNIPVILHWHFGRIPLLALNKNWEWKLLSLAIRKSAKSIVLDQRSSQALEDNRFKNIEVVPNPIGSGLEVKSRALLKVNSNRKEGRLIFVGHIIKGKGVYELVEACSSISIIKELVLIGPYEEAVGKELNNLACKRENGIWLKMIGEKDHDQVLELMKESPLLALPSYTEGFPCVIIEAMAMGCAVIGTDVGAIPEMLAVKSHTPCGLCIPVQNISKLKEAIIDMVKDPVKMQTMGRNGIKRVLNNYTLEIVVEQYKAIWGKVLHE